MFCALLSYLEEATSYILHSVLYYALLWFQFLANAVLLLTKQQDSRLFGTKRLIGSIIFFCPIKVDLTCPH